MDLNWESRSLLQRPNVEHDVPSSGKTTLRYAILLQTPVNSFVSLMAMRRPTMLCLSLLFLTVTELRLQT